MPCASRTVVDSTCVCKLPSGRRRAAAPGGLALQRQKSGLTPIRHPLYLRARPWRGTSGPVREPRPSSGHGHPAGTAAGSRLPDAHPVTRGSLSAPRHPRHRARCVGLTRCGAIRRHAVRGALPCRRDSYASRPDAPVGPGQVSAHPRAPPSRSCCAVRKRWRVRAMVRPAVGDASAPAGVTDGLGEDSGGRSVGRGMMCAGRAGSGRRRPGSELRTAERRGEVSNADPACSSPRRMPAALIAAA